MVNRLAAMEAFVRVIDTGSFSSAARQLHVGQPAISKAIAQLENRLGVQVAASFNARFDRDRGGTEFL